MSSEQPQGAGSPRRDGSVSNARSLTGPTTTYTPAAYSNASNRDPRDSFDDVPPPVPPKDEIYSRPTTGSTFKSQRTIKYGVGKYSKVELVPQPSDDPNDPLNWAPWRKDLCLGSLLMMAGLIAGMKTAFITTNGAMAAPFGASFTAVANLTAAPLIISSFSGLISLICSKIWGKRPVYLVSFVFIFIGTMWNMTTNDNYGGTMGARVFQGLGWGGFDTLILGSIQDMYFDHERDARVALYDIFATAIIWGSPLLGGLASNNANSFTVQFRIINTFYIVAIPLLVFGVPETSYIRSTSISPGAPSSTKSTFEQSTPLRLATIFNKQRVRDCLYKIRPLSYKMEPDLCLLLQGPRAFVTPTAGLIFALTMIPHASLWSFSQSLSLILAGPPLNLNPENIGGIMTAPWILAIMVISGFTLYRRRNPKPNTLLVVASIGVGSVLVMAGTLGFGFYTRDNLPLGRLNLPLLSFLAGLLAAGYYVLDATTEPLIIRSASFTCSNMTVTQRTIADMRAGVIIWRNLAAGIFVSTTPNAISTLPGLTATLIGFTVVQAVLAAGIAAVWWFFGETIRRGDGTIMNLVDTSILKRPAAFPPAGSNV
ncbi:major facilitator superfamily transporter [Stachybotrys elegans]|uniref:Major facilitator superfamily transporter n=1 Tax=Stachybotrys elegans TaxID=80388 RepID=A0A8K0STY2_9HYPO|nr:major facilitator superfamily transporter [Stachybotrys elegans]